MRRVRADNANKLAAHPLADSPRPVPATRRHSRRACSCAASSTGSGTSRASTTPRASCWTSCWRSRARPPTEPGSRAGLLAAGDGVDTTGEWERSLERVDGGYEDGSRSATTGSRSEGAMGMGYVHLSCGRLEEARDPSTRPSRERRRGAPTSCTRSRSSSRACCCSSGGELDAGMELVEDARIGIQKRLGDCEGGGIALSFLAQMTSRRGISSRALELYAESLATFEEVGDRPEIARVHCETGWTALCRRGHARGAARLPPRGADLRGGRAARAGPASRCWGSPRSRPPRAAPNARSPSPRRRTRSTERAGVVCDHPMDPGVVERIEALKASIPRGTVDGIVAKADELTPAAVLAMVTEP